MKHSKTMACTVTPRAVVTMAQIEIATQMDINLKKQASLGPLCLTTSDGSPQEILCLWMKNPPFLCISFHLLNISLLKPACFVSQLHCLTYWRFGFKLMSTTSIVHPLLQHLADHFVFMSSKFSPIQFLAFVDLYCGSCPSIPTPLYIHAIHRKNITRQEQALTSK